MTAVSDLQHMRLDLGVPSTPANSFITDISLWFARARGGWLATATWVSLLTTLGIPASNARTALHRMTQAGYLERRTRSAKPGYATSMAWIAWLWKIGGDCRRASEPKLTWTVFALRREDHVVRRMLLERCGVAALDDGVLVASSGRLPDVQPVLESSALAGYVDVFEAEYDGFGPAFQLARRCWDLQGIAAQYRMFIRDVRRRLRKAPAAEACTFADVVLTSNTWRRIGFTDPALPVSALPRRWPGAQAQELHDELVDRFLDPARAYVASLEAR